jgi:hypothetical protein
VKGSVLEPRRRDDAIDEIGSVKIYGNLHESVAEIIDAAR